VEPPFEGCDYNGALKLGLLRMVGPDAWSVDQQTTTAVTNQIE
jgi:hypothetical protein